MTLEKLRRYVDDVKLFLQKWNKPLESLEGDYKLHPNQ